MGVVHPLPRNKDRTDAKETYTNRYLSYLQLFRS